MQYFDLTKPLNENTIIYCEDGYTDPPFEAETWSTIQTQGYHVSRLKMGTQTGTHIDAPAHFSAGGVTLEALPVQALIGPYLWVDLAQEMPSDLATHYRGQSILFLAALGQTECQIPKTTFKALLALPCLVWVIAVGVQVLEQEPLYFHRALAAAGKYLIEDLDEVAAQQVTPDGEIIALPLRLSGLSGSPCRVIVRQNISVKEDTPL